MKTQTIFKRSAMIVAVLTLCLLTVLASVPVMADTSYAATVKTYDADKGEWVTEEGGYDSVEEAFKNAGENQIVVLQKDTNVTLDPYVTAKVDKNGYQLNVASHEGFKARIIENRDGTVTVTTYKGQGEWFKSLDVSVGGGFGMRFFFESVGAVADNESAYFEVKIPRKDGGFDTKRVYSKNLEKSGDLYYFTANVAQAQLTDAVSFRIVVEKEDGTVEYGRLRQYAFKDYADMLFESANEINKKNESELTEEDKSVVAAVAPVKSMLNLGAKTQEQFGHNVNDLANEGVYTGNTNPVNENTLASTVEALKDVGAAKKTKTDKISHVEYELYLESRTALQFRFVAPMDGAKPTAAVSYDGVSTQKARVDEGKTADDRACWTVSVANIPTKMYNTEFTVTFKYGNETATCSASVLQWISAALNAEPGADASDDEIKLIASRKNTATAMYQYYTLLNTNTGNDVVKPEEHECKNTHVEIVKAPTCTEAGTNRVVCSDCGAVINTVPVDPGEHVFEVTYKAMDPTCTADGWPAYSGCANCQSVKLGETTYASKADMLEAVLDTEDYKAYKAQGHSFNESKIELNGNVVTETGECKCGKTVTEIVSYADTVTGINGLTEIGRTDTYDWGNAAVGAITFTGKDGAYVYSVDGGEYKTIEVNDNTYSFTPENANGSTVVIAYVVDNVGNVPVATIYNVGIYNVGEVVCEHTEKGARVYRKGVGYGYECKGCGEFVDVEIFLTTYMADEMTATISGTEAELIEGGGYRFTATSDFKSPDKYINLTAKNNVGRYLVIKYRTSGDFSGSIEGYINTQKGSEYWPDAYPKADADGYAVYTAYVLNPYSTGEDDKYILKDTTDQYTGNMSDAKTKEVSVTEYNEEDGTPISPNSKLYELKGPATVSPTPNFNVSASKGGWHIMVLDLDELIEAHTISDHYGKKPYLVDPFAADENGNYNLKKFRLDLVNNGTWTKDKTFIEIAYIGLSDDVDKVASYLKTETGYTGMCLHNTLDKNPDGSVAWYSGNDGKHYNLCLACGKHVNEAAHKEGSVYFEHIEGTNTHKAACADCGALIEVNCKEHTRYYNENSRMYDITCACRNVIGADYLLHKVTVNSAKGTTVLTNQDDGDGVKYTRIKRTGTNEGFLFFINGNTVKTGNYIIIKYRAPEGAFGTSTSKTTSNNYATTTNFNAALDKSSSYNGIGKFYADGVDDWNILVMELPEVNGSFGPDAEGKWTVKFIRSTLWGKNDKPTLADGSDAYIDFAYVAFADNLGAIANYISNEEIKTGEGGTVINPCQHDFADQGGIVPVDGGHTTSCAACGQATGETVEPHQVTKTHAHDNEYHWDICDICGCAVNKTAHTVDATKPFVDNGNGTHTATCETYGEGFIVTCSNTGGMRYNGNTNKYDKICLCGGVVESSVSSFVVYLDASNIQQSGKKNTVFHVVPANGDDPAYLDVDTPIEWADASTSAGKDQYWRAFSITGNTSETGQYLIMKYRNPAKSSVTAYMSTNTDSPDVHKDIPLVKGSQWNVLVYDMTENSNVTPDIDTDGDGVNDSYSVNFIRLGFGTSLSLGSDVIDIAYIGMVDCLDAAIDYVNENEIVKDAEGNVISNNCQHSIVGEEREFYSGVGYANICEICGDYVNVEPFKYTWMPNELMSSFGYSKMTEKVENGVWRLDYTGTTKITDVNAGCNLISSDNSTVKGQYFIVKIRSNQAVGGQVYTNTHTMSFNVTYTAADGTTGTIKTPYFSWSASEGDDWKVLIYDIDKLHAEQYPASKYNNTDAFDVNETIKAMRFDLFDGTYDVGKWIEVAYVGISDSYDDIVSVLGSDAKYCVHNSSVVDTTKWVTSEDGTKCGNPCICGEIVNLTALTGDEKLVEGTAYDETSHTETCTRCSAPIVVEHRSAYVFYESDDKYHPHCKVCDTALDGDAVYFLKQSSVVAGDNTVVTSMENGAYKRITQRTISSSESNVWLINSNYHCY